MFHVGQKVECVDDGQSFYGFPSGLKKGERYTISDVMEYHDGVGVRLVEIPWVPVPLVHTRGWRSTRFRPIVETKTDISIFTEMLKPKVVEAVE